MRYFIVIAFLAKTISAASQNTPTLKSILIEQLKTTHNVKDWFVPVTTAIDGLTPQQANWKDSTENHSIAQLTTHLIFWNQQSLAKFKGEKPDAFDGNNKETFSPVDEKTWPESVKKT